MIGINDFLPRFDGVKSVGDNQWIAKCNCHDDRKASLAISVGDDGRILVNDHGGCKTENILRAVGLSFKDITPPKEKAKANGFDWNDVIATYFYRNGNRKLRDAHKNFMWQHKDGNGWSPRRNNAPPCLFVSGEEQSTVYVAEGEKDAVNLSQCGLYCVSPENGATKTNISRKWAKEYTEELRGKDVRVLPDNDDIGRQFAEHIASELVTVAHSVKLFDLSKVWPELPSKGDISDVLEHFGKQKTIKYLTALEESTPEFFPEKTIELELGGNGKPLQTAGNYLAIFRGDTYFSGVRYNLLRSLPERMDGSRRILWTDADDAKARNYIEKRYGLYNRQRYEDAFTEFQHEHEYHPVRERIESTKWDGERRCTSFLTVWAGAEDTPYTREVSRLIFAGGINRAYEPGCRFDEVAVLIGAQGGGKSTLCQLLGMDADFYAALKTITGQKGNEAASGKWIIELEELLAFIANDRSGTKTEETAKAFLSSKSDYYRRPYDRRPTDNLRQCIFIGTTNQAEFLTDRTGNRRWYPVVCNQTAAYLYDHKAECQGYIAQCWAEMLVAYHNGDELANPFANRNLLSEIKAAQSDAEIDDWRIGAVETYLEDKDCVCLKELWDAAINHGNTYKDMTRTDSRDLANILTHTFGWYRGAAKRFPGYGTQKAFLREKDPEPMDFIP